MNADGRVWNPMSQQYDPPQITLAQFLLARIADDEADRVTRYRKGYLPTPRELVEASRWEAECEAKRRIVALHGRHECEDAVDCATCCDDYPCSTLRLLALPYAGHPDYREEWRP